MADSTKLEEAANHIREIIERNRDEVVRTAAMIKRDTLDSHLLIRSVESGYSYKWGAQREKVECALIQEGLDGFARLMRTEFPSPLRSYRRDFAGDFSFWAILAYHGFTGLDQLGSILEAAAISHSPLSLRSNAWQLEPFLDELRQGKAGEIGGTFLTAMQDVEKYGCHLPRYRRRFYYGILKNSHLLKQKYRSSFEFFLKSKLSPADPDSISWDTIGAVEPDAWERIRPWKDLFGVGPDIFFYIRRDIDFGISNDEFIKLDTRNRQFFDKWRFGAGSSNQTNANARAILRALHAEIVRQDKEWPYTIRHLNFAIYLGQEK